MFLQYGAHVEKHGVGKINWKNAGLKLSHWVNTQRQFQREGRLDPERKRRLDERGFDWDPKLDAWEVMFGELKGYKERFGDCNVPQVWKENPPLGRWVHNQRMAEKKGKLLPERKARLDAVGFEWDVSKLQSRHRVVVACPRQEASGAASGALGGSGIELAENGSIIPRPKGKPR